jgi:hypothetical protein
MTRLSLLEDQKAVLTASKLELQKKIDDIYTREQQAISDALLPFFTGFSPYAYIEVTRGSVYFKADHPDYSYKKEMFNLYLRENWKFDGTENRKSFDGVDLSYYTTSTKGVDEWELKRLRMLGDLAEIVLNDQDKMVDAVNQAVLPFKEEYRVFYEQMQIVNKAIGELSAKINAIHKEYIEFNVMNGGVEFTKGKNIQLKWNYSPFVSKIQLIEMSKSGKKATAIFTFGHGEHTSREENVNVSSIVDQVFGLRDDIVQPVLAE